MTDFTIDDEDYNADMHSPNDMMIDTEHIVEPTANGADREDNLAIINPDNLENEAEPLQDLPRADDRTCSSQDATGSGSMLTRRR